MIYISNGWCGGRTNILIYYISGGTDTNKYIIYYILIYISLRGNLGGGRTNILKIYILRGTDTNKCIIYYILYILILKIGGSGGDGLIL